MSTPPPYASDQALAFRPAELLFGPGHAGGVRRRAAPAGAVAYDPPVMVVERIRHALPAETGALEDLQRRSSMIWAEYRDDLRRHPDAVEVPTEAVLEGRVRVAVGDGRVLGFCTVVPLAEGIGDLDALFVEPESMGRGVGRRLLDDAVAIARGQGVRRLEVTANPRAVGFYEKVGFVSGAVVRTRFGPALRMRLRIPG